MTEATNNLGIREAATGLWRSRWAVGAVVVWLATGAFAQDFDPENPRDDIKGVEIQQNLNARLPLDLLLVDSTGETVRLGDCFTKGKPAILTLNYYKCPMICDIQLKGMVAALQEIDWAIGDEFNIITVSFDPTEGPELAAANKDSYCKLYGRTTARSGWRFMTGSPANIRKLTEIAGFGYRWNESRAEWAHQTALIICTPDGHIARYIPGVAYEPDVIRGALLEASNGKIGSISDAIFFLCYHYDPDANSYVLSAMKVMRLGGTLVAIVLFGGIAWMFIREKARRRAEAARPVGAES
ncbi:MAG: SCO family protein [Phycisphaerales bacterium]|nr:SCO family protein [Phycisphaerales bacterium]